MRWTGDLDIKIQGHTDIKKQKEFIPVFLLVCFFSLSLFSASKIRIGVYVEK